MHKFLNHSLSLFLFQFVVNFLLLSPFHFHSISISHGASSNAAGQIHWPNWNQFLFFNVCNRDGVQPLAGGKLALHKHQARPLSAHMAACWVSICSCSDEFSLLSLLQITATENDNRGVAALRSRYYLVNTVTHCRQVTRNKAWGHGVFDCPTWYFQLPLLWDWG